MLLEKVLRKDRKVLCLNNLLSSYEKYSLLLFLINLLKASSHLTIFQHFYSSSTFLPEDLEKFRSTELNDAPLEGSTIFFIAAHWAIRRRKLSSEVKLFFGALPRALCRCLALD